MNRLSEASVKAVLIVLVLSGVAVGLSERLNGLPAAQQYGEFVLARERMDDALRSLQDSPCWRTFEDQWTGLKKARELTVSELRRVECGYPSNSVQFDGVVLRQGAALSEPPKASQTVVNENQLIKGESGGTFAPVVPAAPAAPHLDVILWMPLLPANEISQATDVLFNDARLADARKYSNFAAWEVYLWEQAIYDVRLRRTSVFDEGASRDLLDNLRLGDLQALNSLRRTQLSTFEEQLRKMNSVTGAPGSSIEVRSGTAALGASIAIAVFMLAIAAYGRASIRANAFSEPSSVYAVFSNHKLLEIAAVTILCIPIAASLKLFGSVRTIHSAFPNKEATTWLVISTGTATLITILATIAALTLVVPRLSTYRFGKTVVRRFGGRS